MIETFKIVILSIAKDLMRHIRLYRYGIQRRIKWKVKF